VDLGTALEEFAVEEARRKKKGGRAGTMQIRPKRRAPISQVLLVGGATRMPAFQRFVKNMTGLQPKEFTVDPDEVSCSGCMDENTALSCFPCPSSQVPLL
jgi:molecular chaperone DnaK (HSP70)